MRLVHFSHRGLKRFGVLLSDNRVLDLTHFFRDERVLRSAGEEGQKTVREAIERAHLRRSCGGTIYALNDIVIENPGPADCAEDEPPAERCDLWTIQAGIGKVNTGFGVHLVRRVRAGRR